MRKKKKARPVYKRNYRREVTKIKKMAKKKKAGRKKKKKR